MSEDERILVERRGRVGIITLNRPGALNALNEAVMRQVVAAAAELDADRAIGAIVVTGAGRAFAAGADIKEMAVKGYADVYLENWFALWDRFAATRTPLIAAVAGFALGGGCELAMMCDIIVAADTAKFGQPEIKLGIIPGMGGSQRLTLAVGKYKAMDMILTGRTIGAEEGERIGLVSRVVPEADLMTEALGIAETIAEKSLPALYAAKEAVSAAFEAPLPQGIRFERRAFHAMFALDDRTEGMNAFAEKREPHFTGR